MRLAVFRLAAAALFVFDNQPANFPILLNQCGIRRYGHQAMRLLDYFANRVVQAIQLMPL